MSEKLFKEFDQCPICGDLLFVNKKDASKLKCDCCGFQVEIETKIKIEDAERLKQASDALRSYEFEKAENLYDLIMEDNREDSEVYLTSLFGKLLSSFGVVYIKDYNNEAIPTFSEYNPEIKSVKDNEIYGEIKSLKINDKIKTPYLKLIDKLDKEYKRIDKEINEKPIYDVFLCTKISLKIDNNDIEGYTKDSKIADGIYNYLTKSGYKVFYSDKCCNEIEYDSQILSALLKSKKMLLICTRGEYLRSPWVQSEWRRWLNFINCGKKEKNSLVLYFPNYDYDKFYLPRVLRKTQRFTIEMEALNSLVFNEHEKENVLETKQVDSLNKETELNLKKEEETPKKEIEIKPKQEEIKLPEIKKSETIEEKKALAYSLFEKENYTEALPLLESLSESGDLKATKLLAKCYYEGLGCEVNHSNALGIYEELYNTNKINKTEKCNLACLYYNKNKNNYKGKIVELLSDVQKPTAEAKKIIEEITSSSAYETSPSYGSYYESYSGTFIALSVIAIFLAIVAFSLWGGASLAFSIPGVIWVISLLLATCKPFDIDEEVAGIIFSITSLIAVIALAIWLSIIWIWWIVLSIALMLITIIISYWIVLNVSEFSAFVWVMGIVHVLALGIYLFITNIWWVALIGIIASIIAWIFVYHVSEAIEDLC